MDTPSALTTARWATCPVCRGATQEPFVAFPELAFVRCPACRVVYKSFEAPQVRPPDFYEQDYFHGRKSGRDRRFDHRARKAMRWIVAAMQHVPAASVLDVGCSLGYVIEGGRRLGLRSAGMDISEYAVKVCQERGYEARVGTLDRVPFDGGAFDVVVMKHVLEHTPDPARALAEIRRVLTPKGVALIAVPDVGYWKGLLQRRSYRYFRPDDLGQQHYVYYALGPLTRLLASSGFEVRATSKGMFRAAEARKGPGHRAYELARSAALSLGFGLAAALHLRRELFVIAARTAS